MQVCSHGVGSLFIEINTTNIHIRAQLKYLNKAEMNYKTTTDH